MQNTFSASIIKAQDLMLFRKLGWGQSLEWAANFGLYVIYGRPSLNNEIDWNLRVRWMSKLEQAEERKRIVDFEVSVKASIETE